MLSGERELIGTAEGLELGVARTSSSVLLSTTAPLQTVGLWAIGSDDNRELMGQQLAPAQSSANSWVCVKRKWHDPYPYTPLLLLRYFFWLEILILLKFAPNKTEGWEWLRAYKSLSTSHSFPVWTPLWVFTRAREQESPNCFYFI